MLVVTGRLLVARPMGAVGFPEGGWPGKKMARAVGGEKMSIAESRFRGASEDRWPIRQSTVLFPSNDRINLADPCAQAAVASGCVGQAFQPDIPVIRQTGKPDPRATESPKMASAAKGQVAGTRLKISCQAENRPGRDTSGLTSLAVPRKKLLLQEVVAAKRPLLPSR